MDDEAYDDLDGDTDSLDIEECYVVVRDYAKRAIDELDMFEGQVVCVIDDSDKGKQSSFPERAIAKIWLFCKYLYCAVKSTVSHSAYEGSQ